MEIDYLVIDVDGTLTDGSIIYDDRGNELKIFNVRDALGFFCAKEAGIKLVVLTGRECGATLRRMEEMKVDYILQGIKDKSSSLRCFLDEHEIDANKVAFIGDDLNDYNVMKMVGFRACPTDAAEEIKDISDYVSEKEGGKGVLRDVVKYILTKKGIYEDCLTKVYKLNR